MKNLLLFAGMLAASSASATTINLTCPQFFATGQNGGGTVNCAGFSVPGAAQIHSVMATTVFDFTFSPLRSPTASASYTFDMPGPNDPSNTINNTQRPNVLFTTLCTDTASCLPFVGPFSFTTSYTGSTAVTGATFDVNFAMDYSVPEPATFGLVGLALAGATLLRRRV